MNEEPDFDPDAVDWERLEALRDEFLTGGGPGYWLNTADVELYDSTFGRRIAWKWHAVLDELAARGFAAPGGRWLDWGAGSAIATREVLGRFPKALVERLTLVDRSRPALDSAKRILKKEHPKLAVEFAESAQPAAFDLVLVSHVMGELDPPALDELVAILSAAKAFVWVESASRDESRALSAVRERLLEVHEPIAPCTHRESCGVLVAGREHDWCHFFAPPPPHVFTAREWAVFGRRLGVDLRSLPYSFLAMRARSEAAPRAAASRLLGRPRVERASMRVTSCEADGVHDRRFLRRHDRTLFRELDEVRKAPRLVRWRLADGEIVGIDERLA
ncbi:MAG: small ribosomal subunit Rsm22 family protein [Planctomycetes bacterium]|nr:small ribosomal subunit Rsm22 family protein [Planctomycetota bacterium]